MPPGVLHETDKAVQQRSERDQQHRHGARARAARVQGAGRSAGAPPGTCLSARPASSALRRRPCSQRCDDAADSAAAARLGCADHQPTGAIGDSPRQGTPRTPQRCTTQPSALLPHRHRSGAVSGAAPRRGTLAVTASGNAASRHLLFADHLIVYPGRCGNPTPLLVDKVLQSFASVDRDTDRAAHPARCSRRKSAGS